MLPQVQVRREGEDHADQILSKAVKAGRRTYFFDVRATRGDDYFLTITESRKITGPDGSAEPLYVPASEAAAFPMPLAAFPAYQGNSSAASHQTSKSKKLRHRLPDLLITFYLVLSL